MLILFSLKDTWQERPEGQKGQAVSESVPHLVWLLSDVVVANSILLFHCTIE